MNIVIFPFAKTMRQEKQHPKNYPWWPEVVAKLTELGHTIIQVGASGEEQLVEDFRSGLTLDELATIIKSCDTWIGVDSFGQHFCWDLGVRGVAIFGQSDPKIFGHEENINLLKSRDYLRDKQFWLWEQAEFNEDSFVSPDVVVAAVIDNFS
jgi:ADP-heptose:LPS heptosyltransferase